MKTTPQTSQVYCYLREQETLSGVLRSPSVNLDAPVM